MKKDTQIAGPYHQLFLSVLNTVWIYISIYNMLTLNSILMYLSTCWIVLKSKQHVLRI